MEPLSDEDMRGIELLSRAESAALVLWGAVAVVGTSAVIYLLVNAVNISCAL